MTISDIKQWIVSADKLARPKNIYTNFHPVQHPGFPFDRSRQQWAEFDKEAQQHTYTTDLEPGIYDGGKVEVVWEYLNPSFDGVWIALSYEPTQKYDGTTYRQFLRLKQQPKEQRILSKEVKVGNTITVNRKTILVNSIYGVNSGDNQVEINNKIRIRKTDFVILVSEGILPINKLLNPNDNAIKVIQDMLAELQPYKESKYARNKIDALEKAIKLLKS